jgi:hypothetical protein
MVTGRPAVCLCTADSKKAAGYSPHGSALSKSSLRSGFFYTQLFPHFDFLTFLLISPTPQFSAYRRGPSGLYLSPLPPASIPSLYPPPHPPESLPACPCHANCSAQTAYRLFFCGGTVCPRGIPRRAEPPGGLSTCCLPAPPLVCFREWFGSLNLDTSHTCPLHSFTFPSLTQPGAQGVCCGH